MIEEFPFTTKFLNAEKDVSSLRSLIAIASAETKNKLALLTWARLTWEQRVTLHPTVGVATSIRYDCIVAYYILPTGYVRCETLSQMQFGGTQYPTKHVHHLHCNENCCYCDIEY